MTKLEHYKLYLKDRYPNIPQDYNESEGYFYHDFAQFGWRAWQASPKTRPTEKGRITKEQLDAMKADTTDIVDHLRGIYAGAASRYPVTPLMMLAADEIERLRELLAEAYAFIRPLDDPEPWRDERHEAIKDKLKAAINKKPAEAG